MKKLLKIVLWSAVALVALAVLLVATLPLWLGPVARPIANCLGPRITQTDFYLGGLSLNPYTGRLAVRDLRIGNPAGYAEPTALNLGSLVFQIVNDFHDPPPFPRPFATVYHIFREHSRCFSNKISF